MSPRLSPVLCLVLAVPFTVVYALPAPPSGENPVAGYEATLKSAGVKTDDTSLIEFFRTRTASPEQRAQLTLCVRQLGADEFRLRVKATESLIAVGQRAIPLVRPALASEDREVVRRAKWVLDAVEKSSDIPVVLAAAGLLAHRRPAGASEVLLDYVATVDELSIENAIVQSLCTIGLNGGPDSVVEKALTAPSAAQRGVAGAVLARSAAAEVRTRALPLLGDTDVLVRYRVAEGLVAGHDARGLAPLTALLTEPGEIAEQAESLLQYAANETGPDVALGTTSTERRKCQTAWKTWVKEYGETIDLAKLTVDRRSRGLRLVVILNGYGGQGVVWEHDHEHRVRWEMKNVGGPFDARTLPGGRVLIGEYDGRRVTERDSTGKVMWEHHAKNGVLEVQRLPGGNTLVTTNWDITEVTKSGETVFTHADTGGNIFMGQRLPNGNTLYGLYSGDLVELDRSGKELRRIAIERPTWGLINVEVLPDGHYLIPYSGSNRVVKLDRSGKEVWRAEVPSPTCVAALPGGNYLVGSHRMNYVREIDSKGTLLWEKKTDGQVFRVRVR
jgi:outer membrane protein assembly factor BamB